MLYVALSVGKVVYEGCGRWRGTVAGWRGGPSWSVARSAGQIRAQERRGQAMACACRCALDQARELSKVAAAQKSQHTSIKAGRILTESRLQANCALIQGLQLTKAPCKVPLVSQPV